MKTQLHLFVTTFIIVSFISCDSTSHKMLYQSANIDDITRLRKKGDTSISYSQKIRFLDTDSTMYRNLQISYSPIKHLGVSVGHFRLNSTISKTNIRFTNLAVGGYYLFQPKKRIRRLGLQTPTTAVMPVGILFDLYAGVDIGTVKNYENIFGSIRPPNLPSVKEIESNFQIHKYFLRSGIHFQTKLFGLSVTAKWGHYRYTKGVINVKGETPTYLLEEFHIVSNYKSGNYIEPSAKIFIGKENIQGYIGITQLLTFHDLDIFEKEELIYFGLRADIDNFYRGFRRKRKNKLKN